MVAKYRFYQLLRATLQPSTALDENQISQAGIDGLGIEMALARCMGFTPEPDPRVPPTYVEDYGVQAMEAMRVLEQHDLIPTSYQEPLDWCYMGVGEPIAGGHPDFLYRDPAYGWRHYIDLKTTELPTDEHALKLLTSPQMCAYLAADIAKYGKEDLPCLSILLQTRLKEKPDVKFNKDGAVSLSGQTGTHHDLLMAVEQMGDRADERHFAMAFKAPTWKPTILVSLDNRDEILALAEIGRILLDAGIGILESGAHHMVTRPYI